MKKFAFPYALPLACALALVVAICPAARCAGKPFPGYYITLSGDTVACTFTFNDWKVTPASVTADVGGSGQTFAPGDIRGFGITGYGDYRTTIVTYHTGGISGLSIPWQYSDSTETKSAFLKIVVSGEYTLYELADHNRAYYFVSENGGAVKELLYRVREVNFVIEEDDSFRKDIFALFSKEGMANQYVNSITKAGYGSDVESLIRKLNEKHSGIKYKRTKSHPLEGDVFAGVIYNSFPSILSTIPSSKAKFGPAISPTAGITVMYFIPSHFRAFAIGASVGFNHYSVSTVYSDSLNTYENQYRYSKSFYTETYSFSRFYLLPDLFVSYIINPLNKTKLYLKAGFTCNISFGANENVRGYVSSTGMYHQNGRDYFTSGGGPIDDMPQLKPFVYDFHGGVGVARGRSKLEVTYCSPMELSGQQSFKVAMSSLSYSFTVFK